MKKGLIIALVGTLLLLPLPALAGTDKGVHQVAFSQVEEYVRAYNPTIYTLTKSLNTASSSLDTTTLTQLQIQQTTQLASINALLAGTVTIVGASYSVTEANRYIVYYSAANTYLYDNSGTWTVISSTTIVPAPTLLGAGHEAADISRQTDYLNYMTAKSCMNQIASTAASIAAITTQRVDLGTTSLQVEQTTDQIIVGAQSVFLSYFTLQKTRDGLENNLELMQSRLNILTLQQSLGLASKSQRNLMQTQVKQLEISLRTTNNQLNASKKQLNVLMGQDADTELILIDPDKVASTSLDSINYVNDFKDALILSLDVRLAYADLTKQEDAKRSFALAFQSAYQDIQNKRDALSIQEDKLIDEEDKYEQYTLKYNMGMISKIDLETERVAYIAQQDEVKAAERDLLQSYTTYNWMKKGYK